MATTEQLANLMKQLTESMVAQQTMMKDFFAHMRPNDRKGHIDHRSINGPPEWDSVKEETFQEWQIKLQSWLVNQDTRAMTWLSGAAASSGPVTTASLDLDDFQDESERKECKKFRISLSKW